MSGMANEIADRMRQDGIDTSATPDEAFAGSSAEGTGGDQAGTQQNQSSAGTSNTVDSDRGTPPDTIPYSRFTEVNSRLQALREYEQLEQMGISSDSAMRLANFERAYLEDPKGTIAALVDQQDLPDAQKTALKALLTQQQSQQDGALEGDQDGKPPELTPELKEVVDWVRDRRTADENAESQTRLDHVVSHWRQLDERDGIKTTERQRLLYVQSVAGSGTQFQTLEQLAEAARTLYLEDRDDNLGSAVIRRGTGAPLAVPPGGVPGTQPMPPPRSMKEARQRIQEDIAAGLLPDLSPG